MVHVSYKSILTTLTLVLTALLVLTYTANGQEQPIPAQDSTLREQVTLQYNKIKWFVAKLGELTGRQPSASFTAAETEEWNNRLALMRDTKSKYEALMNKYTTLIGQFSGGPSSPTMLKEMAAMNMQFLALQEATQMESRKFQVTTQVSKAEHNQYLIAIRRLSN